ncbi:MAG: nucleoside diphosphate kinase regulator [Desulfobacterota bacterium]|jgi:regulator of nucleoside diphosphate kinase|nr:nucleoside diphosphate kinase regulator [Thermodesulfobacteriota bacterium]
MGDRAIYITEYDLERLTKLIEELDDSDSQDKGYLVHLQEELDHAHIVPSSAIPEDVITMNSQVCLVDQGTQNEERLTLVFPQDADISKGRISVLAPIGTAMLGYRVGEVFRWKVPAGERILKVREILYQPEAAGDYHL